jgi:hypothetical protein
MTVLKREDFKSRSTSKPTIVGKVAVPALGGEVQICKLSAGGRDRVSSALLSLGAGKDNGTYRARLVVETACGEDGAKLFGEEDMGWLCKLEYDLLEPIVDEANKLNRFDDSESLEKN